MSIMTLCNAHFSCVPPAFYRCGEDFPTAGGEVINV